LGSLSTCHALSPEQATTISLIRAGYRTHAATEESARTRLGFLRLTKCGQTCSDSDRVLAEIAHERFCRPRPTAVSGPLDALRQAFVDQTLEVNIHAAIKAEARATLAKTTLDMPPGHDAKAKKAAADKRTAGAAATTKSGATYRSRERIVTRRSCRPHKGAGCGDKRSGKRDSGRRRHRQGRPTATNREYSTANSKTLSTRMTTSNLVHKH
jgi:hypothetical protein